MGILAGSGVDKSTTIGVIARRAYANISLTDTLFI